MNKIENINVINSITNIYVCDKCKISIISNKKLDKCIICSKTIEQKQINLLNSKMATIKFKLNESECLDKIIKSRIPFIYKNGYTNKNIKNNLYKIYLPCLLFNFEMSGDVELVGDVESTWQNGNYKYIKTDKYDINSSCTAKFNELLISCSKIIDSDNLRNIAPFDYADTFDIKELDEYIEYYKFDIKDINKKANEEFIKTIKNKLHNYKKIDTKKLTINKRIGKYNYYLVPIYLLKINNDCIYINGNTGKISKTIGISKLKLFILSVIVFIIYFLIVLFVFKVIK